MQSSKTPTSLGKINQSHDTVRSPTVWTLKESECTRPPKKHPQDSAWYGLSVGRLSTHNYTLISKFSGTLALFQGNFARFPQVKPLKIQVDWLCIICYTDLSVQMRLCTQHPPNRSTTSYQPPHSGRYMGKIRFFSLAAAVGKVYAAREWRRWGKEETGNQVRKGTWLG